MEPPRKKVRRLMIVRVNESKEHREVRPDAHDTPVLKDGEHMERDLNGNVYIYTRPRRQRQ